MDKIYSLQLSRASWEWEALPAWKGIRSVWGGNMGQASGRAGQGVSHRGQQRKDPSPFPLVLMKCPLRAIENSKTRTTGIAH